MIVMETQTTQTKTKQEELDEITKPEDEEVDAELKSKGKKSTKTERFIAATPPSAKIIDPKEKSVELLLQKYKEQIEKEDSEVLEDEPGKQVTAAELDKALGFEEIEITDEQIVKESADYNKKRNAYFRMEIRNDWHKIPIFDHWDNRGNPIYRLKSYKFYDYPYEVRNVIDAIRGEYEDLYRQKAMWDVLRWIRDPQARIVASNFVKAQHKWIEVGSTFILHMKEEDLKKAHKDYILLMIDAAMYRQDTRLPNLQIKSKPTSAEKESTQDDSQMQSGIQ